MKPQNCVLPWAGLGHLLVLGLISAFSLSAQTVQLAGPAQTQKIRVQNPRLAQRLAGLGAQLVADYGAFQVYRVSPGLAVQVAGQPGIEPAAEQNLITLQTGALDTSRPEVQALRQAVTANSGRTLHLVQFAGPPKPEWLHALEQSGCQVVTYIPFNAYLIYGDGKALSKMQAWAATAPFVQWEGAYLDQYKIHSSARMVDAKGRPQKPLTDLFAVQLVADPEANAATLKVIDALKLEPIRAQRRVLDYLDVLVRLPAAQVAKLAQQPEVVSIEPYIERQKFDERQDQILAFNMTGTGPTGPGYLAWLASKGFTQAQFTASGFAVDISDSGVDNGTTTPGHFGLYQGGDSAQPSRIIYNRLEGTPNPGSTLQGCDGHGTLNTHIIAGFDDQPAGFPHTDAAGFHYGLGVCPFVKVGSSVVFDPDSFTSPNYDDLQARAYNDGARICANSWGAPVSGDYDVDAQQYDALVRDAQSASSPYPTAGNQPMVIVFAAGNDGPTSQSIGAPGTAKNVFTIGASENVMSMNPANGGTDASGNDGCATSDSDADSANDIASFSSRGPCTDGRTKPDIVAPGTHITGGVGQTSPPPDPTGTGSALPCFAATGVCALPNGGTLGSPYNFFPLGQQFYTESSGTSHSTPAVAGSCALLRQYFINHSLTPPSPAMTKAYLMNSARYLNGVGANDSLYSMNQGMGEVNLAMAFDGTPRILHDQISGEKFTATGQTRNYAVTVTDPGKPVRITVAWTDAPGNTTGAAYNNDLDLTVSIGGNLYKGNVFNGAFSTTGGSADPRNNVESVFLPAGTSGNLLVTLTAASINSDGVPGEAPSLDQDYALVIYNATPVSGPAVVGTSATLTAENCAPANGEPDPGEMVSFNFGLGNIGTVNTTNIVATLLATNGVAGPSGPQTYGQLVANGPEVTRSFSFTSVGVCGQVITPTLHLQDGAQDLGTVTFWLDTGPFAPVWGENFDSVIAPALPAGWTTSTSGAESLWVTSTGSTETAPNAIFSPDPTSIGVNEIVSPVITLGSGAAQLSFRNSYDLESGFDGGVLELSINGGAFTDILSAGGSFANGGYSGSISTAYGNPLGGRAAWTGNSGGYLTTVVNLPAAASGQPIRLKWRCASDSSVGYTGWHIDTVALLSQTCCNNSPVPVPAFSASPLLGGAPLAVTFHDTSTGIITNRFWNFGNGSTAGTTETNFVFTYTTPGTYSISLTTSGPDGTNTLTRPAYITVTNAVPQLVADSFALLVETCTNGVIDSGEEVTVNVGLRNTGTGSTSNLVATLLGGGGIDSPSAPQSYGAMAGGAVLAKPFTFTALGACGTADTATFQLQDGAVDLGTVTFSIVLGQANLLVQNFDSVTPPALPVGWATSATGAESPWVTSPAVSDTAPNAAYAPDALNIGLAELDSPTVTLPATPVQMTFRQSYSLESSYDGGVLEISIGGGAFTDILAAGGSFVGGGYNDTISTSYGNPLGGRNAWSGDSGGFILTTVNLPAAALGQTVRFRWLCGSDDSFGESGWYVDTVRMVGANCCTMLPLIVTQPQNQTCAPGGSVSFNVLARGTAPLTYQWHFHGTNMPGATTTTFTRPAVQSADAGPYEAVVSNPIGSVTSRVATLTVSNPLRLLQPHYGPYGNFSFILSGAPGSNYVIEATTNFNFWAPLGTYSSQSGQIPFNETNPPGQRYRFYRAKSAP